MWLFNPYHFTELFKVWKLIGVAKCIICQQDKSKPLKCPLDSLDAGNEAFYSSFLTNVKEFHSIDALPTNIYFGDDINVDDLKSHHVSWHKSCHLKYSASKLARETKIKSSHAE